MILGEMKMVSGRFGPEATCEPFENADLSELLNEAVSNIHGEISEYEVADELDEEIRALTKQASEKTYIGGLTKECVEAFVSMVYLYDDQTMKIEFNCEDVIRRALEKYI